MQLTHKVVSCCLVKQMLADWFSTNWLGISPWGFYCVLKLTIYWQEGSTRNNKIILNYHINTRPLDLLGETLLLMRERVRKKEHQRKPSLEDEIQLLRIASQGWGHGCWSPQYTSLLHDTHSTGYPQITQEKVSYSPCHNLRWSHLDFIRPQFT